jgi:hypothetical protein
MKKTRFLQFFVAMAISISILGLSTESHAWKGLDTPPFPRWSPVPVQYYVNKESFPPNIASVAESRIASGFGAWSAPKCTYFDTLLAGDLPGGTYDINDGKNVVLWINKPNAWPQELGPEDSVIGVTLPVWSNDGMGHSFIDDADIIFNNIGFCWYDYDSAHPDVTCTGGKPVDTLSIITHEQGHFLGLGHTNVSGATMEPAYLGGNDLASIEQDDIDGVCALYPLGGMISSAAAGGVSCDACKQSASINECQSSAKLCTSSCLGLGDCVLGCPRNDVDAYDKCATQCTAQFNDGLSAYVAFNDCVCSVCAAPCAVQCNGAMETGSGPCDSNATGASSNGGQGGVCYAPQFSANGGCGCAVLGSNEHIGALSTLGILLGAWLRRRRFS